MDLQCAFLVRSVLGTAALATAASADVLIVDVAGTCGELTDVQSAVDAALEGDTILVRPGFYALGFWIQGKSLTVLADGGGGVTFGGTIAVQGLARGQAVVLAGLAATGHSTPIVEEGSGLWLADNAGSVRAQDCTFHGGYWSGARVVSCEDVVFVRCLLQGGSDHVSSVAYPISRIHGVHATSSSVALYECEALGGNSQCGGNFNDTISGTGAVVDQAGRPDPFLFGSGTAFTGAGGVDCSCFECAPFNGPGARVLGSSTAQLVASTLTGGAHSDGFYSEPFCDCCLCGTPAAPDVVLDPTATLIQYTEVPRQVTAPYSASESTTIALHFEGTPGDRCVLRVGTQPDFAIDLSEAGPAVVADPAQEVAFGLIPPEGTLDASFAVPALGPGECARTLFLQGLFVTSAGTLRRSAGVLVVLAYEEPGTTTCFGIGCPCGNDDPDAGCVNSSGSGARITATGTTSVCADDLVLTVTGIAPGNSTIVFAGDATFDPPLTIGDGFSCTGGLSFRYPGGPALGGTFTVPNVVGSAPPGYMAPGFTRQFQAWSRDVLCGPPPSPCPSPCGGNVNLSSGYSVVFTP